MSEGGGDFGGGGGDFSGGWSGGHSSGSDFIPMLFSSSSGGGSGHRSGRSGGGDGCSTFIVAAVAVAAIAAVGYGVYSLVDNDEGADKKAKVELVATPETALHLIDRIIDENAHGKYLSKTYLQNELDKNGISFPIKVVHEGKEREFPGIQTLGQYIQSHGSAKANEQETAVAR